MRCDKLKWPTPNVFPESTFIVNKNSFRCLRLDCLESIQEEYKHAAKNSEPK